MSTTTSSSTTTTELNRVWEPLTVGDVEIPNRLMMTPHGMHYGVDGLPSDRLVAYYDERAQGGAGLLGCNGTAGHRYALGGGTATGMTAYEDRCVPHFARLADAVHAHDSRIFIELAASGINDTARTFHDDWHPVWGMSPVPSPASSEQPAAMDQEYIDTMVADFGVSAANMQAAGIDGIELHGAHGYLFMQALSPIFNQRTDRYGGTPRKRCRLLIEVATSIRERVGDGYPVGLRYTFSEFLGQHGITPELSEEYLDILAETGLFTHFDVSAGSDYAPHNCVAPMGAQPDGFIVPFAARAKAVVGDRAKVFVVGRIRSVEHAEQILVENSADMVALTRAQIADPHLVRKAREGRSETTHRCVGANECITAAHREVACTVNPLAGREHRWSRVPSPAAEPKRVAIIGAGPAGLRCAGTAAARGHDVDLYERATRTGGHLEVLRRMPGRANWGFLPEDLERTARDAGARIHLGTEIDAEGLAEIDADVVIVATGSTWDDNGFTPAYPETLGIPGADGDDVIDVGTAAERVLADPSSLGRRIVIIDDSGQHLPIGVAEIAANAGCAVTIVTRHLSVGRALLENYEANVIFPRVVGAGVVFLPQRRITGIDPRTVRHADVWGAGTDAITDVDAVVLSLLRTPVDGLFAPADARFDRVIRIGDALTPRTPSEVIFEAEKVARAL